MLTMSIHKMGSFEIVISTLIGLSGGDGHCQPGVSKIIPIKMKVNNGAHGLRKHQKLHLHFDGWFDWWQTVQNFTDILKKKKFFVQRFSNVGSSDILMQLVFSWKFSETIKGPFLQQLLFIVGINCCVLIGNIKAFLREHQGELIFVSNFDEF